MVKAALLELYERVGDSNARKLLDAFVGKLYRSRVAASGGVLPKAWRITAGKLPKGVHFDRKLGLLSGTPTKPGRYRLTFQVTDGLKVVAKKTLRIDVLP